MLRMLSAVLAVAATVPTFAAQRHFVASYGVANPACSIGAPCRQFADAIAVVNPKGEVIVLDSAGYGSVTITQSVSIIAPPGVYAGVSVFSGDGITVNGAGIKVILRGLTVNGQGGNNGIVFTQGANLHIENCVVSGMNGIGLTSTAANSHLLVGDTLIRENGGGGVKLTNGMLATFDRVQIKQNTGHGLYALNGPIGSIKDSTISHSSALGAFAESTLSGYTKLLIENSQIVFNDGSGVAAVGGVDPSATALLTVQGSNLSNNAGNGIVGFPGDGTVWIAARNNMIDNNDGGIRVDTSGTGSSVLTIADNLIHDNVLFGLLIGASSSSIATLSANTITRNGAAGIYISGGAIVQTLNNNAVTYNNPDLTGTLNTLVPK